MHELGREAEAVRQSATAPVGDFEAQLSDAGVLLREGLGHGDATRQERGHRGFHDAGREVGRRLEQAQTKSLLLTIRLQSGNRAAELEHLEREAVVKRGAEFRGGCWNAGGRSCRRLGDRRFSGRRLWRWGTAVKMSPRTGLGAGNRSPLGEGLAPPVAQVPPRPFRHVRGVSW